jgi:signal transduction histidine kinase
VRPRTVSGMDACTRPARGLGALLVAFALVPPILALSIGPAYVTLPGGWWVLVVSTLLQLGASVTYAVFLHRPAVTAAIVAAVSTSLILAGDVAPGVMYRVTSATVPWIAIAASMAGGNARTRAAQLWLALASVLALRFWHGSWSTTAQGLTFVGLPVLAGLYVAARRQVVAQLRARVAAGEREQRLLAERARTDERARLAEEMHDVVTHRISLMVLQAGALRVSATDPATRESAEELRLAGVQALDELRDLVGVLRGPRDDELTASPRAPDLGDLVHRSIAAGLDVRLASDGDPSSVAPVVTRTVYRIVQESLANVGKHAPGAATTVTVRYRPDGVEVRVVNEAPDAAGRDPELVATGSGQGLAGLARRVELMRGAFRADRGDDGRFTVDAALPAWVPTGG